VISYFSVTQNALSHVILSTCGTFDTTPSCSSSLERHGKTHAKHVACSIYDVAFEQSPDSHMIL
jgi:hypothetical protein